MLTFFGIVALSIVAAKLVTRSSGVPAVREFSATLQPKDRRTVFVSAGSVAEAAAKAERQYPGYQIEFLNEARALGRCDGCQGPVFDNEPVAKWPDGTLRHVVCVEVGDATEN